jgi:hypothetical protein
MITTVDVTAALARVTGFYDMAAVVNEKRMKTVTGIKIP